MTANKQESGRNGRADIAGPDGIGALSLQAVRIAMRPFLTTGIRRVCVITLAMLGGIVIVLLGAELVAWENRDQQLRFKADAILKRGVAIATESRMAVLAVNRLRSTPCSQEDIAKLRLVVSRSTYLASVGRIQGNRVLCDGASSVAPAGIELGPPGFVRPDGSRFWRLPLYSDYRMVVTAQARAGVIVFARASGSADVLGSLGAATATLGSSDGGMVYAQSARNDRLVGAQYRQLSAPPRWFDHEVRLCSNTMSMCATISQPAQMFLDSSSRLILVGLCGSGALFGLLGVRVGGSLLFAGASPERRLKRAIETGQIHVHYQPLVQLSDRRLVGFEALARWRLPDGGQVSPEEFVPLAERSGLLPLLTERVVASAFRDMSGLLAAQPDLYVSINIGVESLFSVDLIDILDEETHRYGIGRHRIALEITERETGDMDRIAQGIQSLRLAGYRVFLDDFGTGYSSLAYLATLPIDAIKLDKLFSRSFDRSLVGTLVLRQICAMVESLDLALVFEGVETEEQALALLEVAPEALAQGWLFGRPVPAAELG